ncbi:MAG: hypothetical protein MUD08_13295, partial [Cytophagales bacterium]|nr:hypothetical protein [Cytophagales bacterium]
SPLGEGTGVRLNGVLGIFCPKRRAAFANRSGKFFLLFARRLVILTNASFVFCALPPSAPVCLVYCDFSGNQSVHRAYVLRRIP